MRERRDQFEVSVGLAEAKAFQRCGQAGGGARVVHLPAEYVADALSLEQQWTAFAERGLDETVQPHLDRIIMLAAQEAGMLSDVEYRCTAVVAELLDCDCIGSFRLVFRPLDARSRQEVEVVSETRLTEFISEAVRFAEELSASGGVPFPAVVESSSGKKVIPVSAEDGDVIDELKTLLGYVVESYGDESDQDFKSHYALAETAKALGQSQLFEVALPLTAEGKKKSAGYPNLEIRTTDGRIYYLSIATAGDEQVFSGLRSFYFEPKKESSKITEDARHLQITFITQRVEGLEIPLEVLVSDLSTLRLRFKPEFQASNVDLLSKCVHVTGYRA